jgi:hypothetical protein
MADEVAPMGRFSPAKGLWVDRNDRSVKITGQMELYGPEATAERATLIQNTINTTWTQSFPDGYSVACNINVQYRPGNSGSGLFAEIETMKTDKASQVDMLFGRKMLLNANESNAYTWTPAHEFGHVLGMKDRYSESIKSQIKGAFGGQRSPTVAHAGYRGNLMADDNGTMSSQNIADLASENAPSPYWMNDDDHVRDWVNGHPDAEIAQLSTAHKLKAIRVLMGGWIDDVDVRTIGKICASVKTRQESQAIQGGINLLNFSSIGQRTQMRVIFAQMP